MAKVRFYLFDERLGTFACALKGWGWTSATSSLTDVSPFARWNPPRRRSPGEFAHDVVRAVEDDGVQMVIIDSINGYLQSMPEERLLPVQVHELLSYLAGRGVTSVLTLVQRGSSAAPSMRRLT